jgi:plasmid stability protein
MESRNLTINLPEPLIQKLRIHAAKNNRSMTAVVKEAVERVVDEDAEAARAAGRRLVERLRKSPGRGIGGKITWTRDELYER